MVNLKSALTNGLIVGMSTVVGVLLVLLLLEGFLLLWAYTHPFGGRAEAISVPLPQSHAEIVVPQDLVARASSRHRLMTMPDSWKRVPTSIAGAARAEYWQGVLHIYNKERMRWASPLPPKREDHYRVMVIGDSLTYGEGLAEEWRFSNLLEQWLSEHYRIEFINLGRSGFNSEDILRVVREYLPALEPDLVLYAVCLNDFLPSRRAQYEEHKAYALPLPNSVTDYLFRNTRMAAFLSEAYDGALRRLRLRYDFFQDILADFNGYQRRFAHDVMEMNRAIQASGLPPMLALVIDQYPTYGGLGHRIARTAELALAKAGASVIDTEDYYRRYNNQAMNVSRWEGHPNEIANYIWAHMFMKELNARPDLQTFRR
jgi:lysophospholipase L1-like esterase